MAALLCKAAGMGSYECDLLLNAAPMHDIGKIGIPDNILLKQGRLEAEEWDIMKSHSQKGFDILKKFEKLTAETQIIVLQHHERHNGTGYPQGLMGKEIHLYSKICTIADVFEALVAKRPYKKQKTFFEALKIMKEHMSEDFDPAFFSKFVLMFTQEKVKLKHKWLNLQRLRNLYGKRKTSLKLL